MLKIGYTINHLFSKGNKVIAGFEQYEQFLE